MVMDSFDSYQNKMKSSIDLYQRMIDDEVISIKA
jgi:hypothetical protein